MVAFVSSYTPAESLTRPKNRAEDFFWPAPDRAGMDRSGTETASGENGRFSYDQRRGPSLAQGGEAGIEWGEVREGTNPDGTKYTYQEGPVEERTFRKQVGFRRPSGSGRGYTGRNRWSSVTIKAQHVLVNDTDHQLHFIGGNVNFKGGNFGFGIAGGPLSVGLGIAEVGFIRVVPVETEGYLNVHFDVLKKFQLGGSGGVGPASSGFPETYDFGEDLWYSGSVSFELP